MLTPNSKPILTAGDFDTVIGHCAAITDLDAAVFAHDLIRAYPDAKVILIVRRDRDAWCRSVQSTILPLKNDWRVWIRSFFCVELVWVEENLLRHLCRHSAAEATLSTRAAGSSRSTVTWCAVACATYSSGALRTAGSPCAISWASRSRTSRSPMGTRPRIPGEGRGAVCFVQPKG